MTYGNRRIKEMLGAGIVSARRWCLIMLGEDPQAALHAGKPRLMTRSEAFRVYFGYHLNRELGISSMDAKIIAEWVCPFIEEEGFLPKEMKGYGQFPSYLVFKRSEIARGYRIKLKTLMDQRRESRERSNRQVIQQTFISTEVYKVDMIRTLTRLPGFGPTEPETHSVSEMHLNLTELVRHFIKAEDDTKDMG